MKRLVIGLAITVVVLVSCATTPTVSRNIDVQIKSETNSGMAEIAVIPTWREKTLFIAEGYSGFHGSFKNTTDKIVRIVWEKSSISYNGSSSTIFLEGQKYINASEPMSPTVIPAKGSVEKDIFSASQPDYVSGKYGGWRMINIPAQDVVIVLCIESGGQEDYYTVSIHQ
jgi:hypothetical protein